MAFGAKKDDDDAEGEGESADPEAECTATFKPLVQLEEVASSTGEEDEDFSFEACEPAAAILDISNIYILKIEINTYVFSLKKRRFHRKAKAYRFSDDSNEWKEKGVGPLKLLQHKETKKIRLLMRRDKTLKICANFLILPGVKVSEHAGSDKSAVFTCQDFSDESTGKQEKFCVRFGTIEKMEAFRKAFAEAQKNNAGLGVGAAEGTTAGAEDELPAKPKARVEVEDGEEVTSKAADELAGALGKVAV